MLYEVIVGRPLTHGSKAVLCNECKANKKRILILVEADVIIHIAGHKVALCGKHLEQLQGIIK